MISHRALRISSIFNEIVIPKFRELTVILAQCSTFVFLH
jgi:hypothetical protein